MATDTRQPVGLIASSDYKLSTLAIVTSTGDAIDVKPIMLSLDLFEDIFSPAMTGRMILGDGADIISSYQLHGNEYLLLSIDKPTLNQPIVKTFRIYKISNRTMGDTALQNYEVHFCSEELIISAQCTMSHSYKGMTIAAMVKDILVNRMAVSPSKMGGIFQSTTGNFDLIMPRMQPFEGVNWLVPKAYNTNENLFFFFENRDGYNFTSYENLLKIPPYATYKRMAKTNTDPAQNLLGYNEISIDYDFDILKAMRFGSYGTTLITMDTLGRNVSLNSYSFTNVPAKGLLNGNIPDNGLKNRLGTTLSGSLSSVLKIVASTDSDPTENPAHIKNWMPQAIARLGQINSMKMTLAIPGDVQMKAGRVITVIMPKMLPQKKSVVQDNMRTGNYLVAAVHHSFQMDIMATVIEVLSDSVSVALNSAQNSTGTVQQLVKK